MIFFTEFCYFWSCANWGGSCNVKQRVCSKTKKKLILFSFVHFCFLYAFWLLFASYHFLCDSFYVFGWFFSYSSLTRTPDARFFLYFYNIWTRWFLVCYRYLLSWFMGTVRIVASTQRCTVYTFCSLSVFSHTRKIILNKVNALIFLPQTSKIMYCVYKKKNGILINITNRKSYWKKIKN